MNIEVKADQMINAVMGMREEMKSVSNDRTILLLKIELQETHQQLTNCKSIRVYFFGEYLNSYNLTIFPILFSTVEEKRAELYWIFTILQTQMTVRLRSITLRVYRTI